MQKKSRLKIKGSIVLQKMGDKYVAYDNDTSFLHEINETAAFIIKNVKGGANRNKILKAIVDTYHVDKLQAAKDLESFLSILQKKGIIQQT